MMCTCDDCEDPAEAKPELKRLLDLRTSQLAECTRVMREVAAALTTKPPGVDDRTNNWNEMMFFKRDCELAERLLEARAGKVSP